MYTRCTKEATHSPHVAVGAMKTPYSLLTRTHLPRRMRMLCIACTM